MRHNLPHIEHKEEKIISRGACFLHLHDTHLEFVRQVVVNREGLDTTFDEYALIKRGGVQSVSYRYVFDEDYYSLEIYSTCSESTIAIAYPVDKRAEGEKLCNDIFKWSI